MSLKTEHEISRVLRVRGLGWNQLLSVQEYTLGENEKVKNFTAAKRYSKDFQEIYYAEIVTTEVTKSVKVERIGEVEV